MIVDTQLHILVPARTILTFTEGHTPLRYKKTFALICFQIVQSMKMKFTLLSQPLGLLKPMLNVFRTITSASILLKRGDAEEGMVDYVTEMIAKHSCKYYEYGSIEYLLFLSLGEYMLLSD